MLQRSSDSAPTRRHVFVTLLLAWICTCIGVPGAADDSQAPSNPLVAQCSTSDPIQTAEFFRAHRHDLLFLFEEALASGPGPENPLASCMERLAHVADQTIGVSYYAPHVEYWLKLSDQLREGLSSYTLEGKIPALRAILNGVLPEIDPAVLQQSVDLLSGAGGCRQDICCRLESDLARLWLRTLETPSADLVGEASSILEAIDKHNVSEYRPAVLLLSAMLSERVGQTGAAEQSYEKLAQVSRGSRLGGLTSLALSRLAFLEISAQSLGQARRSLEERLAATPESSLELRTALRAGLALEAVLSGQYDRVWDAVSPDAANNPAFVGSLLSRAAQHAMERKNYAAASSLLGRSLPLLRVATDSESMKQALVMQANALQFMNRMGDYRPHCQELLTLTSVGEVEGLRVFCLLSELQAPRDSKSVDAAEAVSELLRFRKMIPDPAIGQALPRLKCSLQGLDSDPLSFVRCFDQLVNDGLINEEDVERERYKLCLPASLGMASDSVSSVACSFVMKEAVEGSQDIPADAAVTAIVNTASAGRLGEAASVAQSYMERAKGSLDLRQEYALVATIFSAQRQDSDIDPAIRTSEKLVSLARRIRAETGDPSLLEMALTARVTALLKTRRTGDIVEALNEAASYFRESGPRDAYLGNLYLLFAEELNRGQLESASRALQALSEGCEENEPPAQCALANTAGAKLALTKGDLSAARLHFESAERCLANAGGLSLPSGEDLAHVLDWVEVDLAAADGDEVKYKTLLSDLAGAAESQGRLGDGWAAWWDIAAERSRNGDSEGATAAQVTALRVARQAVAPQLEATTLLALANGAKDREEVERWKRYSDQAVEVTKGLGCSPIHLPVLQDAYLLEMTTGSRVSQRACQLARETRDAAECLGDRGAQGQAETMVCWSCRDQMGSAAFPESCAKGVELLAKGDDDFAYCLAVNDQLRVLTATERIQGWRDLLPLLRERLANSKDCKALGCGALTFAASGFFPDQAFSLARSAMNCNLSARAYKEFTNNALLSANIQVSYRGVTTGT